MKQNNKALTYALTAVFLWSTVATAFKVALQEMDSFHLLLRAVIWSAVALFILIVVQGKTASLLKMKNRDWIRIALLALVNPVGYYLILFRSYELLPAQIAQPLNYTWPVMLVLLSVPILRQALRRIDILSLGLCLTGVILISQGGSGSTKEFSRSGIILALSSSVLWALYWLLNSAQKGNEIIRMFWSFTAAIPVLLIIKGFLGLETPAWTLKGILSSAYVGLFEMGITFVFWAMAMKLARRSADISNIVYLAPFLSLVWISIILGETIYWTTVAGLITIVTGILAGKLFTSRP